jgi:hypothetical protein
MGQLRERLLPPHSFLAHVAASCLLLKLTAANSPSTHSAPTRSPASPATTSTNDDGVHGGHRREAAPRPIPPGASTAPAAAILRLPRCLLRRAPSPDARLRADPLLPCRVPSCLCRFSARTLPLLLLLALLGGLAFLLYPSAPAARVANLRVARFRVNPPPPPSSISASRSASSSGTPASSSRSGYS